MRVLFCHDGPLRVDSDENYYGIAHNDEMFKRYYAIANELSVAIRTKGVSINQAGTKLSKISISPFHVIDIPNMSSVKGAIFKKKESRKKIKEAVEVSDFIVVRFPSLIGFIAYDEAKKQNKPCLVEVVACPWDAFWNHSILGKFVAPLMYWSTKKRVWNAKYVVYVTNNFLQDRYPTKGENVNCSNVALTKFDDDILKKRREKIQRRSKNSKLIIGTTASVNIRYKGQQYIIKALGKLKKQGITNIEYQLVGAGDQTYLKSIAKEHDVLDQVKFLGPMVHKDVFGWLEKIDLYTQPSRQEGLPRALIEAMSRGVPAFGARTAGIPELLEEGFIFSNTSNNVYEICEIINSFTGKTMEYQSKRNYEEAKKYDKTIIDERRRYFFQRFKENS